MMRAATQMALRWLCKALDEGQKTEAETSAFTSASWCGRPVREHICAVATKLHIHTRLTVLRAAQTTIMAAAYDGGVVLGADSRTSTGNYVVSLHVLLSFSPLACCSSCCAERRCPSAGKSCHRQTDSVDRQRTPPHLSDDSAGAAWYCSWLCFRHAPPSCVRVACCCMTLQV